MILLPTVLYTFVAITGLMGCLMSLVLYFLKRTYPRSIEGLDDWALFPLLAFFSSVLYGMQEKWHPLISMALPNLLVVLTALAFLRGTYKHFEKPINTHLLHAVVFMASIFILWSSGKNEYYVDRLIFITGFLTLTYGAQLKLLWKHRKGSFATHFMLITLVLLCGVMVTRLVTAIMEPPPAGIFVYSPLQAFYLASYSFGVLLLGISAILISAEQLRAEMEKLLKYDALTGALTRRTLLEHAEDEVARSSRQGSDFSVLLIDLDNFKAINDKHGHQVGDEVLIRFVQCVEQVLRRPSAIGRYGGEEFLVLLPDASIKHAIQVAERLQNHLRTVAVSPRFTVSIGVASFLYSQHDTLDAMIGRADAAMYTAKSNGRDRIEVDVRLPLDGLLIS